MKDILGANPNCYSDSYWCRGELQGVVDLIKMKAILWHDETMGAEYDVEDIPADLADEAAEWRDKLLRVQQTSMMRLWNFISMVRIFQKRSSSLLLQGLLRYGVLPNVRSQCSSVTTDMPSCILSHNDTPSISFHSPFMGRYSPGLQVRLLVLLFTTHVLGKRERISRLFQMNSKQEIPMESIDAGDIGCRCRFQGYPYR